MQRLGRKAGKEAPGKKNRRIEAPVLSFKGADLMPRRVREIRQHRGALEADNDAASRAFVAERDHSNRELGSIIGRRLAAEKREIEALIKAAKGKS